MATIKVFDSRGVKTLVLMGNANEQDYDTEDDSEMLGEQDEEQDDNPF